MRRGRVPVINSKRTALWFVVFATACWVALALITETEILRTAAVVLALLQVPLALLIASLPEPGQRRPER